MGASVAKQAIQATTKAVPNVIKGLKSGVSKTIKGLKSGASKTVKGIKSGIKKGVAAVQQLKSKITGFGKQGKGSLFKEGDPVSLGRTVNTQGRVGRETIKKIGGTGGRDYKQAVDIYGDMLMNAPL